MKDNGDFHSAETVPGWKFMEFIKQSAEFIDVDDIFCDLAAQAACERNSH